MKRSKSKKKKVKSKQNNNLKSLTKIRDKALLKIFFISILNFSTSYFYSNNFFEKMKVYLYKRIKNKLFIKT